MRISGSFDSVAGYMTDLTNSTQSIANPSVQPVGATYTDTSPLPSASGSGIMSSVGDTALNFLKAVAGYNLQKDQLEVQKIAATRGDYPATTVPTTRTITQIAG